MPRSGAVALRGAVALPWWWSGARGVPLRGRRRLWSALGAGLRGWPPSPLALVVVGAGAPPWWLGGGRSLRPFFESGGAVARRSLCFGAGAFAPWAWVLAGWAASVRAASLTLRRPGPPASPPSLRGPGVGPARPSAAGRSAQGAQGEAPAFVEGSQIVTTPLYSVTFRDYGRCQKGGLDRSPGMMVQ